MANNPEDVNKASHATMADVAQHAGVSLKSVSRVINNEPHVSPKLKSKVEAAILALDYVPDMAARSLAGARCFTIGLLFDNPSPNYTMKMLAGAYSACLEQQYHLRIDSIDSSADTPTLNAALDAMFRNARSDGFIVTPPLSDDPRVIEALERRGARYARLAPRLDPNRSMAVMIDDAAAAARVADLFYDQGHRRIGILNGPDSHGAAFARRSGFVDRLAQRDPHLVVAEAVGAFAFEGGIAGGLELLNAPQRPTAIFATNDDSAAGAMVACTQLGLAVPTDVSLCGFDDSWVAKTVWPYLTTVFQPIEAMAKRAAQMVISRETLAGADKVTHLDFELMIRGSVGPPPVS
jgi:LacI family transcriptional regulator